MRAKCMYCGQWGKPYHACESCGAPVSDEVVDIPRITLRTNSNYTINNTVSTEEYAKAMKTIQENLHKWGL